jgi:hypothetical protein
MYVRLCVFRSHMICVWHLYSTSFSLCHQLFVACHYICVRLLLSALGNVQRDILVRTALWKMLSQSFWASVTDQMARMIGISTTLPKYCAFVRDSGWFARLGEELRCLVHKDVCGTVCGRPAYARTVPHMLSGCFAEAH